MFKKSIEQNYKFTDLFLTEVSAKSCNHIVKVELSPVELTAKKRNELKVNWKNHKQIQLLKNPKPIHLILKIVGFERTIPLQRSEVSLFITNESELIFYDAQQKCIVDIDEPLEIIFQLHVSTECLTTLKETRATWWKDGNIIDCKEPNRRVKCMTEQISENGTLSLLIDPCRPEDSGSYQVKLISFEKTLLSSTPKQIAIKYEKPLFIQPLPNAIEIDLFDRMVDADNIDTEAILTCEFTGKPMATVSWHEVYKDGRTVPITSSDLYEISTALPSNISELRIKNIFPERRECVSTDGVLEPCFICLAESCIGSAETSTKFVFKNLAPKIITKMENLEFQLGRSASIVSKGIGWPCPKLKWILNGSTVGQDEPISVVEVPNESYKQLFEVTQMLRIAKVTSDNEGTLKVVAISQLGSDLQEFCISIEPTKPIFLENLSDVRVKCGETIFLRSRIFGHPPPKVNWLRNGKALKAVKNSKIETKGDEHCLRLSSVNKKSSGKYSCKATNSAGEAVSSADVVVDGEHEKHINNGLETLPIFTKELQETTTLEGCQVVLECSVAGFPQPEIKWYKSNIELIEDETKHSKVKVNPDGSSTCCVVVDCVQQVDAGEYKVVATNSFGKSSSAAKLIIAEEVVSIVENKMDWSVFLHESCTLVVVLNAGQDVEYNWLKGDKSIKNGGRFHMERKEINGRFSFELKIEDLNEDDEGTYEFQAANKSGKVVTATGFVKVEDTRCGIKDIGCEIIVTRYDEQDTYEEDTIYDEEDTKYDKQDTRYDKKDTKYDEQDTRIPKFKKYLPALISHKEGKRALISCIVIGHSPLKIKWMRNGNPVITDKRILTRSLQLKSINQSTISKSINQSTISKSINQSPECVVSKEMLVIRKVLLSDSSNIRLEVSNDFGMTSSESKLIVGRSNLPTPVEIVPPLIVEDLMDKTADLNEACSFTVLARGRPTPEIKWFRNEDPVESSERVVVVAARGVYSLIINHVVEEDAAVYRATLWNDAGMQTTSAQLIITNMLGPNNCIMEPKLESLLKDMNIHEGETCDFKVMVTGLKPMSIIWYKDGVILDPSNSRLSFKDDMTLGEYHLNIKDVVVSDTGRYTIMVENNRGRKVNSAMLSVTEVETLIVSERIIEQDDDDDGGQVIMELLCLRNSNMEKKNMKRRWIVEKAYFATDQSGHLVCQKWFTSSKSDYVFSGDRDATYLGPDEFVFAKQTVELEVVMKYPCKASWMKDGITINTDDDDDGDLKYESSTCLEGQLHTLMINGVCDEDEGVYTFKVLPW